VADWFMAWVLKCVVSPIGVCTEWHLLEDRLGKKEDCGCHPQAGRLRRGSLWVMKPLFFKGIVPYG